ncbi:MAG: acyl-CoA dehydrogenase family protein, partial [Acidimicrobiales bacterium]
MSVTDDFATDEQRLVGTRLDELLAAHDPTAMPTAEFLGARFDAGLAWVWFPKGLGGLGLSQELQGVVERELRKAGAPNEAERNVIGYG